jgi:methylenetetrahydrofolate--tRNA-(uracil-5-)-methyltransferase
MASYVSTGGMGDFIPMNANFGIVTRLEKKVKGGKAVRNEALSARALELLAEAEEQIKA